MESLNDHLWFLSGGLFPIALQSYHNKAMPKRPLKANTNAQKLFRTAKLLLNQIGEAEIIYDYTFSRAYPV